MKKILSIFILVILIFLVSCDRNSFEKITASEAKAMRDNDSSVVFVDVREQYEYDTEHIQAAILLPLDTIEDNAETILSDKDATYIIYCRSGNRSNQATIELVELGYTNIYDMGGIIYWNYETVT
ncbi:MAG: rhodanese-like domain-containing protein [Tenericutes bacterium]|nr:rhodanese-like domain-containing protein [Mycoplasmatota bacterium]